MSAATFCCTHPQQRTDSPEPPSRPLASIDGIFAAAVLPEDHPHAPKFQQDRKPDMDASIVRSPNIANKLKMQFRRKSTKSLIGKEKDYDGDAHKLTSQEVLCGVEPTAEHRASRQGHRRFGSVPEGDVPDGGTGTPDMRSSDLRSLEYLRPLIQKPSDLTVSGDSYNVVDVATRVAARQHRSDVSKSKDAAIPGLLKSFSTPMLQHDELSPLAIPRRSCSEYGLADSCAVAKQRSGSESGERTLPSNFGQTSEEDTPLPGASQVEVPSLHVQEPTNRDSSDAETLRLEPAAADHGFHLHEMDISQQLRSMSQLSDVAEDYSVPTSPYPWNFHHKERSDLRADSGRHRQIPSSGVDGSNLPSARGRVRSPFRDTASSVYSRPTSAGMSGVSQSADSPEPRTDYNALFVEWPLKPSASAEETRQELDTVSEKSAASERRNKPLPATPDGSRKDSGTASFVTATSKDDRASVKFLSPPQRPGSLRSKSSSSTLTKTSKQSKFLERFSPPKKLVRKRRSIFKFLRPGSRKQQGRSVSTPFLGSKSKNTISSFDGPSEGPSDDPALLTVQYELTEQPKNAARSMSMNQLGPGHRSEGPSQVSIPQTLVRRPTHADYERSLSVAGDDRRRPSTVDVDRMKDIDEEDHRESLGLRRRLSRANALKDDASPLMAQALEKHQQEKALFRSASKQRESLKPTRHTPAFSMPSFAGKGSKLPVTLPEHHNDLLDPLEKGHFAAQPERSYSTGFLGPPGASAAGSSRRGSSIAPSKHSPSIRASLTDAGSVGPAPNKTKIGSSLDSWSRYPSHTRVERCGSAGRGDSVIARDFAIDINPDEIHDAEETDPASPDSKQASSSGAKRSKRSLTKSRSLTFSGIVRYYSNLFHTSGFHGQNRRTSVTTGGRLEYPELEMLPPQLPAELSSQSYHHHHSDHLGRLKDIVKEDAEKIQDYVKDEEGKFEDYMRKEEHKLESFARKEETKFEDFVRKEEGKFMGYVKEEEDKFMHHHYHHSSEHEFAGGRESPFRELGLFDASHNHDHARRSTMIGPMDNVDEAPSTSMHNTDGRLLLDGAASCEDEAEKATPSKAEIWSDVYRACLSKHDPAATNDVEAKRDHSNPMPPPTLKPAKPRSPEQKKDQPDAHATIRRFPSVTVIDDRKGHLRSVSLISVKTSRSTGFQRSSTHDLLELIQAREREEREKLLQGIESGAAA